MTPRRSLTLLRPMPSVSAVLSRSSRHPQAVVFHFDDGVAVLAEAADGDASAADLARKSVLDRVFHQRLQDHAGHDRVERVGADLFFHLQLRAEPDDLDVEVFVDRLELLAQRDEMIAAAEQTPQQTGEFHDDRARRLRLRADQRLRSTSAC